MSTNKEESNGQSVNSTERPTPITDRIARAACDDKGMLCRPQLLWDALGRLERERDEAREQLAAERAAKESEKKKPKP